MTELKTKHFLLLDYLRLFAVFIIAPYYLLDFSTYQSVPTRFPFVELIYNAGKYFSISGFILVFLGFFFLGFSKNKKKYFNLLILVFLGLLTLNIFAGLYFFQFSFHWDTYHFITFSLFIIFLISKFNISSTFLVTFGFILLWIPFWQFINLSTFSHFIQSAIVGACKTGISDGTWPIFPWIGLVLFAYGLGNLILIHKQHLFKINGFELLFWLLILIPSSLLWGRYANWNTISSVNCFLHRQSPLIFWSHFVTFLFLARIAFLNRIQFFLANKSYLSWISRLSWSYSFGLSFLIFLLLNALVGHYFYSLLEQDLLYIHVFSWSSIGVTHIIIKFLFFIKNRFL